jgi:hypothetical protein
MENSIGDSLCNGHDEQCSQFTEGFYRWNFPSVFLLVKMTRYFLKNIFFTVIPSIYTEGIFSSVKFP